VRQAGRGISGRCNAGGICLLPQRCAQEPDGSSGENALVTDYTFEPSGALRQLDQQTGDTTLSSYSYTYTVNGLQLSKTDQDSVTTTYT
jgi:hypothetical protein